MQRKKRRNDVCGGLRVTWKKSAPEIGPVGDPAVFSRVLRTFQPMGRLVDMNFRIEAIVESRVEPSLLQAFFLSIIGAPMRRTAVLALRARSTTARQLRAK